MLLILKNIMDLLIMNIIDFSDETSQLHSLKCGSEVVTALCYKPEGCGFEIL
jgi:hypothetical protein